MVNIYCILIILKTVSFSSSLLFALVSKPLTGKNNKTLSFSNIESDHLKNLTNVEIRNLENSKKHSIIIEENYLHKSTIDKLRNTPGVLKISLKESENTRTKQKGLKKVKTKNHKIFNQKLLKLIKLNNPVKNDNFDFKEIARNEKQPNELAVKELKKKGIQFENVAIRNIVQSEASSNISDRENNSVGIGSLFASLSSGEEGALDVGALLGTVSGLITDLLGPGGLDIPSVLSTASSLIAGLLGGDENFGKVLASYIGILIEGLTGGGGAENNGFFFGNFIGTLLAYLSADPNEEEGPKPKIFLEYFFTGSKQSIPKLETNSKIISDGYAFEFAFNSISTLFQDITSWMLKLFS